jgi:uncharacterized protein
MILALSYALLVSHVQAGSQTLICSFGDAEAGSNTYTENADGSYDSVTNAKIQGYDLVSKIKIVAVDGKPTALDYDESLSQKGKVIQGTTMKVVDGKAIVHVEGSKDDRTFPMKLSWPMMANWHPQFLRYLRTKDDWKKPSKVSVFLIEALNEIGGTITPASPRNLVLNGESQTISVAKLKLKSIEAELAIAPNGTLVGFNVESQKFKFYVKGGENLFADPMAKFPELSQVRNIELVRENIQMPTRDGVLLSATVVRPKNAGKYPTILSRTPYGREGGLGDADGYAKRGFAYVSQDVRGTGDSLGDFDPFINERKDGYDTIDWISKQPWSDAKVGMIGGSYVGYVQWAAAVERHPALKCIVPQVSPPMSAMWNLPYEGGVPLLLSSVWWLRIVDNPKGTNLLDAFAEMKDPKQLLALPLSKVDDGVLGFNSKLFDKWLAREGEEKWGGWAFQNDLKKVTIPGLHISGWFDGDGIGTKLNWDSMRGNKNQWLIYGPWTHAFNTTSKMAELDFGKDAILDLNPVYLRWFDTWLKDKKVGIEKVAKVKFFVMGANKWVESANYPTPESTRRAYQFDLKNKRLVPVLKLASAATYTYDPSKAKLPEAFTSKLNETGSMKVTLKEFSKNSVILRSPVLTKNTAITGPIDVSFDFKCSAKDTDFFATIYDLAPTGNFWFMAAPGKIRASYIRGMDKPRALIPGQTYRANLKIWDTAHELKKGHQLAVVITSEEFPASARNLGTAEPIANATKMVKQVNTILSSPASPGKIEFQVLWEK